MSHDISKSLPSRSFGTQDEENRRFECIANELRRRCSIYEAQFRAGETPLNLSDVEAQVAEA